jgi:hypothetical protein
LTDNKTDAKNRVRWRILVEALCSAAEWWDVVVVVVVVVYVHWIPSCRSPTFPIDLLYRVAEKSPYTQTIRTSDSI